MLRRCYANFIWRLCYFPVSFQRCIDAFCLFFLSLASSFLCLALHRGYLACTEDSIYGVSSGLLFQLSVPVIGLWQKLVCAFHA